MWPAESVLQVVLSLHVTSLLTGTDTVIALPPRTETNGEPGSFDQARCRSAARAQGLAGEIYLFAVSGGLAAPG
jgi:hypothetical protein